MRVAMSKERVALSTILPSDCAASSRQLDVVGDARNALVHLLHGLA